LTYRNGIYYSVGTFENGHPPRCSRNDNCGMYSFPVPTVGLFMSIVQRLHKSLGATLETVQEEVTSVDMFGDELDNKIKKIHHTLDSDLKRITTTIRA
jgi:hypothetical protein